MCDGTTDRGLTAGVRELVGYRDAPHLEICEYDLNQGLFIYVGVSLILITNKSSRDV